MEKLVADISSQSKYPWFGELALTRDLEGPARRPAPPRGGTAFTLEPTHLLTLKAGVHGKRLLEVLPEFARMLIHGDKP